jgi:predicted nucleic acid-binding protein
MVTKIYIDTSIVGGYFDDEFSVETKALFERLENKEIMFIISSVLTQELQKAPKNVQSLLDKYDKNSNLERIKGYNGVNLKCGYSVIEIRNPKELLKYDSE